jgi:hypothetical protein
MSRCVLQTAVLLVTLYATDSSVKYHAVCYRQQCYLSRCVLKTAVQHVTLCATDCSATCHVVCATDSSATCHAVCYKQQCTAALICDRMTVKYTHDEHSEMLLILGTCNRLVLVLVPVLVLDITRTVMCFNSSSSVCVIQEL